MLVASQDFVEGVLVRTILPKNNPPTIVHDKVLNLIQVSRGAGAAGGQVPDHCRCLVRSRVSLGRVLLVCRRGFRIGEACRRRAWLGVGGGCQVMLPKDQHFWEGVSAPRGWGAGIGGRQAGRAAGERWLPAMSPCPLSVLG